MLCDATQLQPFRKYIGCLIYNSEEQDFYPIRFYCGAASFFTTVSTVKLKEIDALN